MKAADKKQNRLKDDSLFGLLSSYKSNNTFIRMMISEKQDSIIVQISDNPAKWLDLGVEKPSDYKSIRRLEIGTHKISLKYLCPEHLVKALGPTLGINLPIDRIEINNNLAGGGCLVLKTSLKYKGRVLQGIKKLLGMNPQKKYEILEKNLSENQE